MPIYEYRCDQCDHELEMLQKISDEPVKTCPECGENSLRKLVSAAAFKLKGTGWYETDFKDKKPKKDGKTTSGSSETGSKKTADSKKSNNDNKSTSNSSKNTPKPPANSSSSN